MKKLLLILIFVSSILVNAQPPTKFFSTYGGNGYDEGYDLKQTLDGGYIITGSTSSLGQGNTDMYLLKLDSMGVKKFETSFGGVSNEVGKSVVQLLDSSYVIAGFTSSTGVGGYDIFLVKTDKNGALLWQKTIGGTDWDFAYSMEATADGGFIIAGTTYSFGRGNADGYIVKTDANGNVVWQKTYGGLNDDEFKSVIQTTDGNYALTGYTKSYNDIDSGDVWTFKVDAIGDSTWCKFYGGSKEDFGNQIIEHPSGDLYIAGASQSFGTGLLDGYILHTDNNGVYIFQRLDNTSTSFQEFVSIVVSKKSQNIVNTIAKETFTTYGLQSKMLEMNLGLNYLNAIDFGSVLNDHTYKMIATKDKGYACIGYTYGYNSILSNCYFVKVDSNLQGSLYSIVSIEEFNIDKNKISIFPNPTSDQLTFQLSGGIFIDLSKVKLFDLLGKEIDFTNKIIDHKPNQILIDVSDLRSGIYYLKYFNYSEKISIIHH